jgi:phosphoribosylformylglycinamidine synthase
MKAHVYVTLKRRKMQYRGVADVRQGKYFVLTLEDGIGRAEAEAEVARIAREVLTNPVIEESSFRLED